LPKSHLVQTFQTKEGQTRQYKVGFPFERREQTLLNPVEWKIVSFRQTCVE